MRPGLCILTTANHREINACTEKPENGVNGVKFQAAFSTLRRLSDTSSGSPNRAAFDSAGGNPCHVPSNTNITHLAVWKESGRYWRTLIPTSSSRSDECERWSPSSVFD
jgi:hypothetical protein